MGPPSAATLDRLADAAWPALVKEPLGPWLLRANHGVTGRANSVLTSTDSGHAVATDVAPLIAAAEAFYARHRLPPCFYISPAATPSVLDQLLADRGYAFEKPTEVWTADVQRDEGAPEPPDVTISAAPTPAWFDCAFDEPQPRRQIHADIVNRISLSRAFASVSRDGVVIAAGLAVSQQQCTGIFCMATRPEHRRRGLASRVLHALTAWARSRNDRHLYLQVMTVNEPARNLYRRHGFAFTYPYHYRTKH